MLIAANANSSNYPASKPNHFAFWEGYARINSEKVLWLYLLRKFNILPKRQMVKQSI